MKIVFEVDDEKIPSLFKDRPDIIFAFLHDNLYVQNFNKAENNVAHRQYRKAFYDQLKLNGEEWVDGIEDDDDAKIQFARLLLDSIKMGADLDIPPSLDIDEVEKWAVNKALIQSGNITKAAKLLGISRDTLHTKIKKFEIKFETNFKTRKKSVEMNRE